MLLSSPGNTGSWYNWAQLAHMWNSTAPPGGRFWKVFFFLTLEINTINLHVIDWIWSQRHSFVVRQSHVSCNFWVKRSIWKHVTADHVASIIIMKDCMTWLCLLIFSMILLEASWKALYFAHSSLVKGVWGASAIKVHLTGGECCALTRKIGDFNMLGWQWGDFRTVRKISLGFHIMLYCLSLPALSLMLVLHFSHLHWTTTT